MFLRYFLSVCVLELGLNVDTTLQADLLAFTARMEVQKH